MNFLNNVKVSLKLGILGVITLFAMGVIGLIGYYDLKEANQNMNTMYL